MGYNRLFVENQVLDDDFSGSPQIVVDASLYFMQLVFTGTVCQFTASLEVSADAPTDTPTNWDTLPNSSSAVTEAGSLAYNVSVSGYSWVRLKVVDDSTGTNNGTLTGRINVKGPL